MSDLLQIRSALDKLESYTLPERYNNTYILSANNDNNNNDEENENTENDNKENTSLTTKPINHQPEQKLILDPTIKSRYQDAKSQYLTSRIEEIFMKCVSTFDGNTFEFPPVEDEEDKQKEEEERIIHEKRVEGVKITAAQVAEQYKRLKVKYETYDIRREELKIMVEELERKEKKSAGGASDSINMDEEDADELSDYSDDDDDEDSMGYDGNDEEMIVMEEEQLAELMHQREELEMNLKRIQQETEEVTADRDRLKKLAKFDTNTGGTARMTDNDINSSKQQPQDDIGDSMDLDKSVEQIRKEIQLAKEKAEELKDMAKWYDDIRTTTEELSGIRVLEVIAANSNSKDEDINDNDKEIMPKDEEQLVIKVELLNEYILRVGLSPRKQKILDEKKPKYLKTATTDIRKLFVSSATFLNNPTITGDCNGQVTSSIPSLNDLVDLTCKYSNSSSNSSLFHQSGDDLRFILREAISRIRGVQSRVNELASLRNKYLTNIEKDGEEVLCTLNYGVTVVLRLTADCPMLPGSIYIDQIVGIGGWDRTQLENAKAKINDAQYSHATDIMDAISKEVEELMIAREGNGDGPLTPHFPSREMR